MYLILLLVLVVGSVKTEYPLAETKIVESQSKREDYLLPTNVKPFLYQIEIEPNFEANTFRGSVNISFSTAAATNVVVLHKDGLIIDNSSISLLNEEGNKVNSVIGTSYSNDDRHFYSITFEEHFKENKVYTLVIYSFTSTLQSLGNTGFYSGIYKDTKNVIRKFATTQFEPTYARKAFPCFDEPALKAQFDITIIRPAEYHSISNMPKVAEREISKGRVRDKFARSVKMSTYLVAFVISDFANVSQQNHRVFGRPAAIAEKSGDFALHMGIKVLNAISEFVNVPFTLEKMDQVAIPEKYFFSGAMENWGIVIYTEPLLMTGPGIYGKEVITGIISHEFTHQWFGNLVSPAWWSYVWLNEGFARYFEYYFTSRVLGNAKYMNGFISYALYDQLNVDSQLEAKSMNHDVGSPTDAYSHLRRSYNKPALIIRMARDVISAEVFRKGLNIYLNKMQFQAAHPRDLYSSWQQALDEAGANPFSNDVTVSSFMNTWDSNAGYPLITVRRNYDSGSVIISQRRFIQGIPNNTDPSIWYVPISYTTGNSLNFSVTEPKLWLTNRSMEVVLDNLSSEDWLIVNIQQTGFYRVNYDDENWQRIIDFSKTNLKKINKFNRGQLIDDARALYTDGLLSESIYNKVILSIKRETDYVPLKSFINCLDSLDTYMSNTRNYEEFKVVILDLLNAAVNSVGFVEKDDDSYLTKLKRDMLLPWVCRYGRSECRDYGLENIKGWNGRGKKVIVSDFHAPLLCAALRNGEQSDWDFVFDQYMNEEEPVVRQRLLKALSCIEYEEPLGKLLSTATLSTNEFDESDLSNALLAVCNSGTYGRDYLYNYIDKNWKEVTTSLKTKDFESVIKCIASKFSTEKQYTDMQALLRHEVTRSAFGDVLKATRSNIDGANKFVPAFSNWISEDRVK